MIWPPDADQPLPPDTSTRRGRPPAPISATAGLSHRAWLVPIRGFVFASGLTFDQLAERSGYSKTRISDLLRGNGYYPAWQFTSSVVHAAGLPLEPMLRLWKAGAREAGRDRDWIESGIQQVALHFEPAPLPYRAFADTVRTPYTAYARAFLLTDHRAGWVVGESLDILWLSWQQASTSDNLPRYAWQLLRNRVMARAHHHDGHPDLRTAVFSTAEVHDHMPGHLVALTELTDLFDAIGRLSPDQMDIAVLRYLCAVPPDTTARLVGRSTAVTHATDHHLRATLEHLLPDTPQE
ncbi:XRE family transcriptional regulator [Streptomyces sp. NPDC058739]|uniref:XRE family transcriptional regulator n=1 Tax=Streptomyces sp. NPDC058739 TaxID=3346618 RepID=UPI00367CA38E